MDNVDFEEIDDVETLMARRDGRLKKRGGGEKWFYPYNS
jgi:hypothetical protein